ncbi:hypothetical protein AVEN_96068-1 [Araneus ventricosus]|uniref:Uncharacterized protein n=1 Tax=Araneus ventricosus TaxID=182803 RepID=A0A4Y2B3C9_ARAVE|nr:hypothetical protein AVEN_96068-1 [Araneus ventricosus]
MATFQGRLGSCLQSSGTTELVVCSFLGGQAYYLSADDSLSRGWRTLPGFAICSRAADSYVGTEFLETDELFATFRGYPYPVGCVSNTKRFTVEAVHVLVPHEPPTNLEDRIHKRRLFKSAYKDFTLSADE